MNCVTYVVMYSHPSDRIHCRITSPPRLTFQVCWAIALHRWINSFRCFFRIVVSSSTGSEHSKESNLGSFILFGMRSLNQTSSVLVNIRFSFICLRPAGPMYMFVFHIRTSIRTHHRITFQVPYNFKSVFGFDLNVYEYHF